jgi:predicted AAA+ superfamily ATPase
MIVGVFNMHGYIRRFAENALKRAMKRSPAVAVLGPRQCGKSTLAMEFVRGIESVYLDLQDRTDLNKLNEPELFFERYRHQLICLDEIQRIPDLFTVLRSEIDRHRRPGRFLILGSASRDLIRQTKESLAGRIAFLDLTPFILGEVDGIADWQTHWLRGGFPMSLLADNGRDSFDWRLDFIRTFLERDIPALGFSIPMPTMERLWRLLAHNNGQVVNFSKLAGSADISVPTLKNYLSLLEQTYMVLTLRPYESNLKKRFVKSPRVYLRDSGILHALLDIESYDRLLAHPANGASWEGFVLENLMAAMPRHRPSFIRTSNGAEIDLVMESGGEIEVFEIKLSKSPRPSRGFYELVRALKPQRAWLIAPVEETYDYSKNITIISPSQYCRDLRNL